MSEPSEARARAAGAASPPGEPSDRAVRRILHCDMDCFYAAVHARDDPSLRGRPLVIGGDPDGRGVVAAASYEARAFGIHSAMPAAQAKRLCPQAVFLRSDFDRYRAESEEIFALFRRFTPIIQTVALDEAYLDVTEHLGEHETATAVARAIRRAVREERRLTVSVGVGPNRLVAKIASDRKKPDGLCVVPPPKVLAFLAPLRVRVLQGVGPATERTLESLGVTTVGELRALSRERLVSRFGRHGETLYRYARGLDDRPVYTHRQRKSLGAERTFARDLTALDEMDARLTEIADTVARGLARRGLLGATVTVKVRYADFTTLTRARTLSHATDDPHYIAAVARELLLKTEAGRQPIRLLGISLARLGSPGEDELQLSLFGEGGREGELDRGSKARRLSDRNASSYPRSSRSRSG